MALRFSLPRVIRSILPFGSGFSSHYYTEKTNYGKAERLEQVLENPAALFIFAMLPDLASMAEYKMYERGAEMPGDELSEHRILDLLKNPNPMQTQKQFIWDYMFWRLLGTANMLSDSKVLKPKGENILYWLSPDLIEWPAWFEKNKRKLFMSEKSLAELNSQTIYYDRAYNDIPFKYNLLKQFTDLSNGLGDWFDAPSKVDALHKVICNSDQILDSKNVNSHLARKFVVSGRHAATDTSTLPMAQKEKENIESSVMSTKAIHGMKSMIDIKRFLDDMGGLEKLDRAYMNDAFFIGKMLNIPKDVIESFEQGATYENQEKARALTISYCIQSAMDDFTEGLLKFYGISDRFVLKADYTHLPFVQVFEKTKAETIDKKAAAFRKLVEGGMDQQQAADFCRITADKFTEPKSMGSATTENPEERSDNE